MTQQILPPQSRSRTLGAVLHPEGDATRDATVPRQSLGRASSWLLSFTRNLAPQDWYIAVYFAVLSLAVTFGHGPSRAYSLELIAADAACLVVGLALTRGGVLRGFANAMVYRLTVWLTVFCSYFQLRHILPAATEKSLDGDLLAFDLSVFHVEPALAWDRFVTPVTTEWFAFFYFGYFFLLAAHVLSMMLGARDKTRLAHFALGIFLVFCTGHATYCAVPGYGPYHYLAGAFHHELTGGPFWHAVQATVSAEGAQKDIFPSLHTACPTYFALFSYRYRRLLPYKYTWVIVAFSASQIIIATMFLRWHYLIDIFAGLTLAYLACTVSEALVVRDARRRERLLAELGPGAVQSNFELLDYSWMKRALGVRDVGGEERAG
jgi:PAP2 superfamily protein